MSSTLDGAQPKRRRTLEQLERKRNKDKALQKAKREKSKILRKQMHDDMSDLQKEVNGLRQLVYDMGMLLKASSLQPPASSDHLAVRKQHASSPWSPDSAYTSNLLIVQSPMASHLSSYHDGKESAGYSLSLNNLQDAESGLFLSSDTNVTTPVMISEHGYHALSDSAAPDTQQKESSTISCRVSNVIEVASGYNPPNYQATQVLLDSISSSMSNSPLGPRKNLPSDPEELSILTERFEQTFFIAVMSMHQMNSTFAEDQEIPPPSPPVADLLFEREGDDVVSKVINKVLRKCYFESLSILFGTHIFLYRLLRVSYSTH